MSKEYKKVVNNNNNNNSTNNYNTTKTPKYSKLNSIEIDKFCPVGIGGTKNIDVSSLKIFIGALSPEITSQNLFNIFKKFGVIREAVVIPDRFRVRSRCYGFVTFKSKLSVEKLFDAVPIYHNNRQLTIVLAATNARPRRANFQTKHGKSGYRCLPEKGSNGSEIQKHNNSDLYRTANIQSITPAKLYINNNNNNNNNGNSVYYNNYNKFGYNGYYESYSLPKYNVIDNNVNTKGNTNGNTPGNYTPGNYTPGNWPNNDISKDFHTLLAMSNSKESKTYMKILETKLVRPKNNFKSKGNNIGKESDDCINLHEVSSQFSKNK